MSDERIKQGNSSIGSTREPKINCGSSVPKIELNTGYAQDIPSDSTVTPRNFFSNNPSINESAFVKNIMVIVEEIRTLKNNRTIATQDSEQLKRILLGYSELLNELQDKVKNNQDIHVAQQNICCLLEQDIIDLKCNRASIPFIGAATEESSKQDYKPLNIDNKNVKELGDIEKKLKNLKENMASAKSQEDTGGLKFLTKYVLTLSDALEIVDVTNNVINMQRKLLLKQCLMFTNQRIHDAIKYIAKQKEQNKRICNQHVEKTEKHTAEELKVEESKVEIRENDKRVAEINNDEDSLQVSEYCQKGDNTDNSLAVLDQEINKELEADRRILNKTDNRTLMNNLVRCCHEFDKSFSSGSSLDELKILFKELKEVTVLMEQHLNNIGNQIGNYDSDFHFLPVVRDMGNSAPSIGNQKENIAEKIKIFEGQSSEDRSRRLEAYKVPLKTLSLEDEDTREFGENIITKIDNSLVLLDNKSSPFVDDDTIAMNQLGQHLKNIRRGLKSSSSVNDEELKRLDDKSTKPDNIKGNQQNENKKGIYEDINPSTEQQSMTTQTPKNPEKFIETRKALEGVKAELNNPNSLTNEQLDKLENILTKSILTLDNMKKDETEEERTELYQALNFYFSDIEERKNQSQSYQQRIESQTIEVVEAKLEEIIPEIDVFVGLETSTKFFRLDETLIRSTLKLDDIRPDKGSELHSNKIALLKKIAKYIDILDGRVKQTEIIEEFEKAVREMLIKVDSFNEKSDLAQEIFNLETALMKFETNQELAARKEACLKEIDSCKRKVGEASKTDSGV